MSRRSSKSVPTAEQPTESSVAKPTSTNGPKLRASCDECNQTKVRCDKTKPSCHRCRTHHIQCVYGLSLRTGKRSVHPSSTLIDQKTKAPRRIQRVRTSPYDSNDRRRVSRGGGETSTIERRDIPSPAPSEDPIDSVPDMDLDFLPAFLYSDDAEIFLENHQSPLDSLTGFSHEQAQNSGQKDHQQGFTLGLTTAGVEPSNPYPNLATSSLAISPTSSARQSADLWQGQTCSNSEPSSSIPSRTHSSFSSFVNAKDPLAPLSTSRTITPPFALQSPPTSSPESTRTIPQPPKKPSSCHCLTFITSAPQKLYRMSNPDTVSFDVALAVNKDVSTRCLQAIECGCWIHDDANGLTLSSIMARMISVYWERARGLIASQSPSVITPPSPEDATAGPSDTWLMTYDQAEDEEHHGPLLSLGAYTLDKEDEARLKLEIVLIELKKTRRLVRKLQEAVSCRGGGTDFWRTLCTFLDDMVQGAMVDLKARISMADD